MHAFLCNYRKIVLVMAKIALRFASCNFDCYLLSTIIPYLHSTDTGFQTSFKKKNNFTLKFL